jgi:diguanylate cyclase (GGDEF)-like protein
MYWLLHRLISLVESGWPSTFESLEWISLKAISMILLFFTLCCPTNILASAGLDGENLLSKEEKAFVNRLGIVKLCVDPHWMPFERLDQEGRHQGIAADLIRLVAQRVGIQVEPLVVQNWDESLAAAKAGKCQAISFMNQTPEREEWLDFTEPLYFDPNVIITRQEHPFISNLKGLKNKTLVLPKGTSIEERVRKDFPNLKIILVDEEDDALDLVSDQYADLTIRSLAVVAYRIRKKGYFNLKISGQLPEYTNALRMGILKQQGYLRDVFNQGVRTLTDQERESITNQHISINVQKAIDYQLLWRVVGVAMLLITVSLFWISKLRRLNKKLQLMAVTDRLTGLYNRLKLDEFFQSEIERSQRSREPFGIILVDVDHFKQLNDSLGHLAGDRALIMLARQLQRDVRQTDSVGRWGGEEFLIICPYTESQGIGHLAEKLRSQVAAMDTGLDRTISISIGVTVYRPRDRMEDMVSRADEALYASKKAGRNRVTLL